MIEFQDAENGRVYLCSATSCNKFIDMWIKPYKSSNMSNVVVAYPIPFPLMVGAVCEVFSVFKKSWKT